MQASNRTIKEWLSEISQAHLTLPRFQRYPAWSKLEVLELYKSIFNNLPIGATLTLRVGAEPVFAWRVIDSAPEPTATTVITEQLLDGQQRLTALWKGFGDKYDSFTLFVVYDATYDRNRGSLEIKSIVKSLSGGRKKPLWVDDAAKCFERKLIPLHLFNPDSNQNFNNWIRMLKPDQETTANLYNFYSKIMSIINTYNIPVLQLDDSTSKLTALDIFVKTNTSSVDLKSYDIVVALVERHASQDLHEKVDALKHSYPAATLYSPIESLLLDSVALRQGHKPSRDFYQDINVTQMLSDWSELEAGISKTIQLLQELSIFSEQHLPTRSVLSVICAIYSMNTRLDAYNQGHLNDLLKKYLWRAFLTKRYQKSSTQSVVQDFNGLRNIINQQNYNTLDPVPIFDTAQYSLPSKDDITKAEWPKGNTILSKAVLTIQLSKGAYDLASGSRFVGLLNNPREYHHLFPKAILLGVGYSESEINIAMNCAYIDKVSNRAFSCRSALEYLKSITNYTGDDTILKERCASHLIPLTELRADFGLPNDVDFEIKVKKAYNSFIRKRAELFIREIHKLT